MNQKEMAHRCFVLEQQSEKIRDEVQHMRGVLLTYTVSDSELNNCETTIKRIENGITSINKK